MRWLLLATIGSVLALALALAEDAPQKGMIARDLTLALPLDSKIAVHWVCPPLDEKTVESADWSDLCFTVDQLGNPWLGHDHSVIMNPARGYQFTVPRPYGSMVSLESGAFLVATATDLGFIAPPGESSVGSHELSEAPFQPITELPLPGCRLFAGAGDCLYLVGYNDISDEDEVYLLRPEKTSTGAGGAAIRSFLKVFTSREPITSVAGDGDVTFVAMGSLIIRASALDKTVSKFFLHPSESIVDLVRCDNEGLFYATGSRVGYVGPNGNVEFLSAPASRICMRNGTLYVLLCRSLGVLAFHNAADFSSYNLAFE